MTMKLKCKIALLNLILKKFEITKIFGSLGLNAETLRHLLELMWL